jgi:hypothetical protein
MDLLRPLLEARRLLKCSPQKFVPIEILSFPVILIYSLFSLAFVPVEVGAYLWKWLHRT